MAIVFDSAADGLHTGGSTTLSWSHNNVAGDLLVVGLRTQSNNVLTVTFNTTEALTQIGSTVQTAGGNGWLSLWYRLAPTTGSHDVLVTISASEYIYGLSLAYVGAAQSGQPPENGSDITFEGSGNDTNVALTISVDQSWIVAFAYDLDSSAAPTAGASTNLRVTNADSTGIRMLDGGPFGTGARNLTLVPAGTDRINAIFASFKPTAVAPTPGAGSVPFTGRTVSLGFSINMPDQP